MLSRHRLGLKGEAAAAEHLAKLGFEVLDRRFACRRGDIDIVCRKGAETVLVEVKTRAAATHGVGAEVISEDKRRALLACAAEYRAMTGWRGPIGFLLAFVRLGYDDQPATIELLSDAIA